MIVHVPKDGPPRYSLICSLLYVALIVYGSLYPFSGWQWPDTETITWMRGKWPRHVSRGDAITNLLAYAPLGYLLFSGLPKKLGNYTTILLVTLLGALLSIGMESLQLFLPNRVSSFSDLVLNGISTFGGALFAWNTAESKWLGDRLLLFRRKWFTRSRVANIGIAAMMLWALSQLAPFTPSLDVSVLKNGLKPLWNTIHDLSGFNFWQAATYSFYIAGLGGIASLIGMDRNRVIGMFAFFVTMVLLCKIPIYGRQLSLEALVGLVIGLAIFVLLRCCSKRIVPTVGATLIVFAFVIDELRPVAVFNAATYPFNWVPFQGQIVSESGFVGILEGLWPFVALAFFVLAMRPHYHASVFTLVGLILVGGTATLEWVQKSIPGRYPDITQVILAIIGLAAPFAYAGRFVGDTEINVHRSVMK